MSWTIASEIARCSLDLDSVLRRLKRALAESPLPDADLSLVFISHARSASLNAAYRKKRKPANVLSFPVEHAPAAERKTIGDVFIAWPVLRDGFDSALSDEDVAVALAIHGMLHLQGFTHETPADAKRMEGLEERLTAL